MIRISRTGLRAPYWVLALLACAAILMVGANVWDDYGAGWDAGWQ